MQGVGMEVAGAQKQTAAQVAKEMLLTARSRSWYMILLPADAYIQDICISMPNQTFGPHQAADHTCGRMRSIKQMHSHFQHLHSLVPGVIYRLS